MTLFDVTQLIGLCDLAAFDTLQCQPLGKVSDVCHQPESRGFYHLLTLVINAIKRLATVLQFQKDQYLPVRTLNGLCLGYRGQAQQCQSHHH